MIGFATILLVIYLVLIGLQESISDSWYVKKNLRWLFFVTLALVGVIIVAEVHPYTSTYLFHLAGLGTWLVAAVPNFKTKGLPRTLHFLGAGMVVVGGYAGAMVEFKCLLFPTLFLVLSGIAYIVAKKNKLYWFEVVAFLGLLLMLNIKL